MLVTYKVSFGSVSSGSRNHLSSTSLGTTDVSATGGGSGNIIGIIGIPGTAVGMNGGIIKPGGSIPRFIQG
jgi:hypothetical protein